MFTSAQANEILQITMRKGAPTWEHLALLTARSKQHLIELERAVATHNLHQVRLAVALLNINNYGFGQVLGVDIEQDIQDIHQHYMDSLDEDAAAQSWSLRKYRKTGMDVATGNKSWHGVTVYVNYLASDYVHPNGGIVPAGTWLPKYGNSSEIKLTALANNTIKSRNKYAGLETA